MKWPQRQPNAMKRNTLTVEIFDKTVELGLTGIPWPEEYGGIDSDYLAYCIAVGELSRVNAAVGVFLSAHTSLTRLHGSNQTACHTERVGDVEVICR